MLDPARENGIERSESSRVTTMCSNNTRGKVYHLNLYVKGNYINLVNPNEPPIKLNNKLK